MANTKILQPAEAEKQLPPPPEAGEQALPPVADKNPLPSGEHVALPTAEEADLADEINAVRSDISKNL